MDSVEAVERAVRRPAAARLRLPVEATGWAVCLAAAANAGAIVWLWLQGGGISGVHGWPDLWTSLGRVTGLLGAYLALLQVLLLARLPWLERLKGFDRLTVWHRVNGKACLYLVLAHVVLITIGYAGSDGISVWSEAGRLWHSYPEMVTATVGTVLLVAVVGTSLVIVRRRLAHESWYAVHVLSYAGIALAWFHQIPTGNELTADATAADYWTGLYLATLALLVLFRLVQPAVRGLVHALRVEEVVHEGPGVVSLRIGGRHLDRLPAAPGQFFLWRFLSRQGRFWEAHPFSLSAAPDGSSLRITVKAAGDFTRRLGEIAPGTRVWAEGPFGIFTSRVRRQDRLLLIGGGIGITPIRALLEDLTGDVVVVYRVLRREDAVLLGELEELAGRRGNPLHVVAGDHASREGARLLTREHLRELVPDLATREVYLCGPPALADALARTVRSAGVPRRLLHVERFAL